MAQQVKNIRKDDWRNRATNEPYIDFQNNRCVVFELEMKNNSTSIASRTDVIKAIAARLIASEYGKDYFTAAADLDDDQKMEFIKLRGTSDNPAPTATGIDDYDMTDYIELSEPFVNLKSNHPEGKETIIVKAHISEEEWGKTPDFKNDGLMRNHAAKFILNSIALSTYEKNKFWADAYFEEQRFLIFDGWLDLQDRAEVLKGVLLAFQEDHKKSKYEYYDESGVIDLADIAKEFGEVVSNLGSLEGKNTSIKGQNSPGSPDEKKEPKAKICYKFEKVSTDSFPGATSDHWMFQQSMGTFEGTDYNMPPIYLSPSGSALLKKIDDRFNVLKDPENSEKPALEDEMSLRIKGEISNLEVQLQEELTEGGVTYTTAKGRLAVRPGILSKGFSKSFSVTDINNFNEVTDAGFVGADMDVLADDGHLTTGFFGPNAAGIGDAGGSLAMRPLQLLANIDVILGIPGLKEKAESHCSFSIPSANMPEPQPGFPKPYKLGHFMKDFIFSEHVATDAGVLKPGIAPWRGHIRLKTKTLEEKTDEELIAYVKQAAEADRNPKPTSPQEATSKKSILADRRVKNALARKNRNVSDQAVDELLRQGFLQPKEPKKIDSLDNAFKFVLSKMDLPTLARKTLECLRLNHSIQDLLEWMCDGLLKTVLGDPDSAVKALTKLERWQLKAPPVVPGATDTGAVLIGGNEIIADLKAVLNGHLGGKASTAAGDDFYGSLISGIGSGPSAAEKKLLLCKLIVAAGIATGSGVASLIDMMQAGELDEMSAMFGKDKRPTVSNCNPKFKIPEKFPFKEKLLKALKDELNEQIKSAIENIIVAPLQSMILQILEACKALPEENAAPADLGVAVGALAARLPPIPTNTPGGIDLSQYLEDLLSRLSKPELCSLLEASAARNTIKKIQNFNKTKYPPIHAVFDRPAKIVNMFKDMSNTPGLNTNFCLDQQAFKPIADLCADGSRRKDIRKEQLRALGLSNEEIEKQMALDNEFNKNIVGEIVNASLGVGADSVESKLAKNLASAMANDPGLQAMNKKLLDSVFGTLDSVMKSNLKLFYSSVFESYERELIKSKWPTDSLGDMAKTMNYRASQHSKKQVIWYPGEPNKGDMAEFFLGERLDDYWDSVNLRTSSGKISIDPKWNVTRHDIFNHAAHTPQIKLFDRDLAPDQRVFIGAENAQKARQKQVENVASFQNILHSLENGFGDARKAWKKVLGVTDTYHGTINSLVKDFEDDIYTKVAIAVAQTVTDMIDQSAIHQVASFLGYREGEKANLQLSDVAEVIDIDDIKDKCLQTISEYTSKTDLQSEELTASGDAIVATFAQLIIKLVVIEYIIKAAPVLTVFDPAEVFKAGTFKTNPIVKELKNISFKRRTRKNKIVHSNLYETLIDITKPLAEKYEDQESKGAPKYSRTYYMEKMIKEAMDGIMDSLDALMSVRDLLNINSCECSEELKALGYLCPEGPKFPVNHFGDPELGFPIIDPLSIFVDTPITLWNSMIPPGLVPNPESIAVANYSALAVPAVEPSFLRGEDGKEVSNFSRLVLERYAKWDWATDEVGTKAKLIADNGDDIEEEIGVRSGEIVPISVFVETTNRLLNYGDEAGDPYNVWKDHLSLSLFARASASGFASLQGMAHHYAASYKNLKFGLRLSILADAPGLWDKDKEYWEEGTAYTGVTSGYNPSSEPQLVADLAFGRPIDHSTLSSAELIEAATKGDGHLWLQRFKKIKAGRFKVDPEYLAAIRQVDPPPVPAPAEFGEYIMYIMPLASVELPAHELFPDLDPGVGEGWPGIDILENISPTPGLPPSPLDEDGKKELIETCKEYAQLICDNLRWTRELKREFFDTYSLGGHSGGQYTGKYINETNLRDNPSDASIVMQDGKRNPMFYGSTKSYGAKIKLFPRDIFGALFHKNKKSGQYETILSKELLIRSKSNGGVGLTEEELKKTRLLLGWQDNWWPYDNKPSSAQKKVGHNAIKEWLEKPGGPAEDKKWSIIEAFEKFHETFGDPILAYYRNNLGLSWSGGKYRGSRLMNSRVWWTTGTGFSPYKTYKKKNATNDGYYHGWELLWFLGPEGPGGNKFGGSSNSPWDEDKYGDENKFYLGDKETDEIWEILKNGAVTPGPGSHVYRELFCGLKQTQQFKELFGYPFGETAAAAKPGAIPIYDTMQALTEVYSARFDAGMSKFYPTTTPGARTQLNFLNNKKSLFEPILEHTVSLMVFLLENRSGGYN